MESIYNGLGFIFGFYLGLGLLIVFYFILKNIFSLVGSILEAPYEDKAQRKEEKLITLIDPYNSHWEKTSSPMGWLYNITFFEELPREVIAKIYRLFGCNAYIKIRISISEICTEERVLSINEYRKDIKRVL